MTVFLRFFSFLLICGAIVAALLLFFKVDTLEVQGNARYTEEEILDITGIEYGQNLFLLDRHAIADQITGQLPYIQSVKIRRDLPDTIVIEVSEAEAVAAVMSEGDAWLISPKGKLLERVTPAEAEQYLQVVGCTLLLPTEGATMEFPEEGNISEEQLISLLQALSDRGMLGETERIECSDEETLVLRYAGRFDVQIPYDADYSKKLLALSMIVDTLEENETGTVILTLPDRSFFKPD